MILFIKTSQGYSGGYKFGTLAKLIDDEGSLIDKVKGGGFDMEYALLKPWAVARYMHLINFKDHELPDGGSFYDIQNVLGYHGVSITRAKSPVSNLHIYEVSK